MKQIRATAAQLATWTDASEARTVGYGDTAFAATPSDDVAAPAVFERLDIDAESVAAASIVVPELVRLRSLVRSSALARSAMQFSIADAVEARIAAECAAAPAAHAAELPSAELSSAELPSAGAAPVAGIGTNVIPFTRMAASRASGRLTGARVGAGFAVLFGLAAAAAVYVTQVSALRPSPNQTQAAAPVDSMRNSGAPGTAALASNQVQTASTAEPIALAAPDGPVSDGDTFVGRVEAASSVSVFYVPGLNKAASSVVVWITDDAASGAPAKGTL
jgi:hypothetical protein